MADTIVEIDVLGTSDVVVGLWGPYWSDVSTAVIVFFDGAEDISFARTTDKGENWSTTEIQIGQGRHLAVWYDKETPGDTGTLVHVAWIEDQPNSARYVTIDVADGSVGTVRVVDATITPNSQGQLNRIAITKAVNGTLIVAFSTQTEIKCYKSTDNFATAPTAIADVYETATEEDWVLLFPANVDAGDVCAMFWDRSADEISLKMYDDSANTWTEFATRIAATAVDDAIHMNMDGAVRHSDSHVLVSWHSDDDTAGDDLQTADLTVDSIASPTVTAKTNVVTNKAESAQVSVFINQQNDDVYIAYLKGGTWEATVDVVFHISTDGMGSWGGEQSYSESAADDFRLVQAGRTVGDAGGRYQPSFFDDDQTEIAINETNDIEIAAAGAPAAVGEQPMTAVVFDVVRARAGAVAY